MDSGASTKRGTVQFMTNRSPVKFEHKGTATASINTPGVKAVQ
jgi:hypothetical protein